MKLHKFKITPQSNFMTYPKGDTLFGQFIYNLFLDDSKEKANKVIEDYKSNPKIIFSDMMPYGYVYKPSLPIKYFDEVDKKEFRKKGFIKLEALQNGDLNQIEEVDFFEEVVHIRNAINRVTFMTGDENFAPYGSSEIEFKKELWLFVFIDEELELNLKDELEKLGKFGFGKKSTIGRGQFKVEEKKDIKVDFDIETNNYISISPTLLKSENINSAYYELFHRFGKFGSNMAKETPFKKPVLMADSGAVVNMKMDRDKFYFGNGVNVGSKDYPSLLQGYSIAIPIKGDFECIKSMK